MKIVIDLPDNALASELVTLFGEGGAVTMSTSPLSDPHDGKVYKIVCRGLGNYGLEKNNV